MKKIIIANLLFALASPIAWAGTGTHGGDEDREFVMRIWRTSATHVERYQTQFPEVSSQVLSQVIENGPRPEFRNRLRPCDGIVDPMACYNSQTGVVTFNRPRFQAASDEEKIRVAAHELFRLVNLDDGYALSQRLLGIVSPSQFFDASAQHCPRDRDFCEFERDVRSLNVLVLPGQEVSFFSDYHSQCFSVGGIHLFHVLYHGETHHGGYMRPSELSHYPSECHRLTTIRFIITNPAN